LPRELSLDLAVQTVMGAAAMVETTKTHPAVLKDKVTTPAGTTISGLHVLERAGVRVAFMDAVMAAAQRSKELGSD
jgi:pyrroline-5-carboxylate reductase